MNKRQRNQQGFTLIEIIAVIILLGVLAATIIPKFSDLTDEAKRASAKQDVAEGITRVNSRAASYILTYSVAPTAVSQLQLTTGDSDAGDYYILYAAGTNAGEVAVSAYSTGEDADTAVSGIARLPQ